MTKSDKYLRFMVIISVKKSPQKSGRMPDYAGSNFSHPLHRKNNLLYRSQVTR